MRILMIASECVPFAKVGGLGDVVGGLAPALARQGHEVMVVLPRYGSIDPWRHGLRPFLAPLGVWMGNTLEWCAVHETLRDGVAYRFIEFDRHFARPGIYHDADFNDYGDNGPRFGFLTRAALQLCRDIGFAPDIVHAHDWPTAAAAAFLKVWHWNDPVLGGAASVLTLHNVAHQGLRDASCWGYLGLQDRNFIPELFEDHGRVSFLKGGIRYSDMVNAVSPTYANETRIPPGGHGLEPVLRGLGWRYVGILNGADYDAWDPRTDPKIPARYGPDDLSGKAVCKRELQIRFGLEVASEVPIVGTVGRLVDQKGMDVFASVVDWMLHEMLVQFVVVGSGEKSLERDFRELPARFPGRFGSWIGYDDGLAHLVEAGSDFFLMPSRFEPCGLNQIYSLRYGTLPIVRATGGLADTVEQYDERTGNGTGFRFDYLTPPAVHDVVGWAVSTWYDRRPHIHEMIRTAMSRDFSWERSAREYVSLYERAVAYKRG